jgi:hypothetical protein
MTRAGGTGPETVVAAERKKASNNGKKKDELGTKLAEK